MISVASALNFGSCRTVIYWSDYTALRHRAHGAMRTTSARLLSTAPSTNERLPTAGNCRFHFLSLEIVRTGRSVPQLERPLPNQERGSDRMKADEARASA